MYSTPSSSSTLQPAENSDHSLGQSPRLSDVPCYTCRRRHVRCDRILPHCAKCAKKGVACSGYQKPLRWADGVAVRGRLKGKTQPVIDSQALSVSQHVLQQNRAAARSEAVNIGLHPPGNLQSPDSPWSGIQTSDTTRLELIRYYNEEMRRTSIDYHGHPISVQRLATITPRAVQQLPRNLLNCILGTAAVHLASRNPDNPSVARLALEAKVSLFEGINNAFQRPQHHRADVLFVCTTLMFAMDVIEHGIYRGSTHFLGAIKLLHVSGGLERFGSYYPHLANHLASTTQSHTMSVMISSMVVDSPKLVSRHELGACFDSQTRKRYFIPCPQRLFYALYDMAECARNIIQANDCPSAADAYTREWIISDALQFSPEEGARDIQDAYYRDRIMSETQLHMWSKISSAWRGAVIIIILRYLFFGLKERETSFQRSRSQTPTQSAHEKYKTPEYEKWTELPSSLGSAIPTGQMDGSNHGYFDPEHLSLEAQMSDPFSATPSPLPSPCPSNENITFDHWNRRYEIHNDAVSELRDSLSSLHVLEDASYLRYVLLPMIVLALVSMQGSNERALYESLLQRFKNSMNSMRNGANPIGGSPTDYHVSWDLIDAYSAETEKLLRNSNASEESRLNNVAPEWNWRHMLQRVNLTSAWPAIAGTLNMELGTEFWAFNVLSKCCTEEGFAAFMEPVLHENMPPST